MGAQVLFGHSGPPVRFGHVSRIRTPRILGRRCATTTSCAASTGCRCRCPNRPRSSCRSSSAVATCARRGPAGRSSGRPAAVLVLLYPDDDGVARVVLTERASRDGHHSGEVSFPGGKAEPDDPDLAATALREAAEEIALDADAAGVRVLGLLEPFWIPVSDFHVTPVIAVVDRPAGDDRITRRGRPDHRTADGQVLPDAPIAIVERLIGEWPLRYGAYDVDGLSVWGATARILSQLGAILAS